MARLLRTRKTWLIVLALLAATTGVIVSLLVLAGPNDVTLTATLYSDVVRFEAEGVASLRVRIYDLSENELWSSGQVMGDFVDWDRTNTRGERLANGYYVYLAQGWNGSDTLILNRTGKVVLLPGDQVELKAAPLAPYSTAMQTDDPVETPSISTQAIASDNSGQTWVFGRVLVGTTDESGTSALKADVGVSNAWDELLLVTDSAGGGSFAVTEGLTGGTGYSLPVFTFKSTGIDGYAGVLAGELTSGRDAVGAARSAAIVLQGQRTGPTQLSAANVLAVRNYTTTLMMVTASGNVGIGTTNATDKLTIEGASGNLIACYPSTSRGSAAVFRVESDGDVYADGTVYSASTAVGSADVAERINVSEWVEAGDVVEIDPEHVGFFRKATGQYSRRVAGIISTSPGVILGNDVDDPMGEWDDNRPVLAIAGRVPVKTSTENGPIAVGDLLVSSSIPGVAMKGAPAVSIGAVVGKAMEPLESGEGVIMAQVTLR